MKNSNLMMAIGMGLAAATAVSMVAMPKKNKIKAKANKAIKTAGQIANDVTQAINTVSAK